MAKPDYDKKEIIYDAIDDEERKVEWKIKGKELTRTVFYPEYNVKIKRIFNFTSRNTESISIDTKTNEADSRTFNKKSFKELKKSAPIMFKKAVKQYVKFGRS